jgi:hypothetical protein
VRVGSFEHDDHDVRILVPPPFSIDRPATGEAIAALDHSGPKWAFERSEASPLAHRLDRERARESTPSSDREMRLPITGEVSSAVPVERFILRRPG